LLDFCGPRRSYHDTRSRVIPAATAGRQLEETDTCFIVKDHAGLAMPMSISRRSPAGERRPITFIGALLDRPHAIWLNSQ